MENPIHEKIGAHASPATFEASLVAWPHSRVLYDHRDRYVINYLWIVLGSTWRCGSRTGAFGVLNGGMHLRTLGMKVATLALWQQGNGSVTGGMGLFGCAG